MLSDVLNDMLSAKEKIRQAIIKKGVEVPKNLPLKDYAEKILEIGNAKAATKAEVENETIENSIEENIESTNKKKRRQK